MERNSRGSFARNEGLDRRVKLVAYSGICNHQERKIEAINSPQSLIHGNSKSQPPQSPRFLQSSNTLSFDNSSPRLVLFSGGKWGGGEDYRTRKGERNVNRNGEDWGTQAGNEKTFFFKFFYNSYYYTHF